MAALGIVFLILIGGLVLLCGYLLLAKIFGGALRLLIMLWPFIIGIAVGTALSNGGAVELGVFIILSGIVGGVFWVRWLNKTKWPRWFKRLMDD
jgi:hypothetical protein